MSTILVTGGAGFIGSHIADALIGKGHAVIILDDLSWGRKDNIHPAALFHHLDIRSPELEGIFSPVKIDFVVHHASQIDVRKSIIDPLYDSQVNICGLINLLENCRRHCVKGLIFASSGGTIYGEPETIPIPEDALKKPISPYGISKLAAEYYLYYYQRVYSLPYIALRYGNVYGPRQRKVSEAGAVAIFAGKMLAGEAPLIFGDGEHIRDYIYIQDIVRANLLSLAKVEKLPASTCLDDRAFNIGSGIGTSVNSLFSQIRELTGFKGEAQYGPAKPGEEPRIVLDIRKAARLLDWRPSLSLAQGMQNTLSYLNKGI
jgi:UDP-glucose 4-epimerase